MPKVTQHERVEPGWAPESRLQLLFSTGSPNISPLFDPMTAAARGAQSPPFTKAKKGSIIASD